MKIPIFRMTQTGRDILAGGLAGMVVDISLFPIDTLKTRFQSKLGFRAAGGFKNIYRGLGSGLKLLLWKTFLCQSDAFYSTLKRHRISWIRAWIGYIFLGLSRHPATKSGE